MKPPAHHGTTPKHSGTKHAPKKGKTGSRKHHVKTRKTAPVPVGKAPGAGSTGTGKPRKLSPGAVACCPAEAVAAAALLAGWPVSDEDVLDLYARCADGPSSGFTIAAALTAGGLRFAEGRVNVFAPERGPVAALAIEASALPLVALEDAAHWPVETAGHRDLFDGRHGMILGAEGGQGARPTRWLLHDAQPSSTLLHDGDQPASATTVLGRTSLILGADLPGPHAVTVAPDGCWISWGEHYDPADFPDAVIEEAWAVSFA